MIETSILRAVLLDTDEYANHCHNIYGSKKIFEILKKTKIRNNFINLCKNSGEEILINSRKKEFTVKKIYMKNISSKLTKYNVKHVFIKGVPLSKVFYKNPSDRIYTDADILIDLKDYENFYNFLDANNFKHNFNYKYLDRIGYTRSALEVIDSQVNLDFHFRISDNFKKNECKLSKYALTQKSVSEGLPIPRNELLLTICLFKVLKDRLRSGPIYLVDSERIITKGIDEDYLLPILSEFNLTKFYKDTVSIINNLKNGSETKKQSDFIIWLFKNEGKKPFLPSRSITLTQIMHFFDPEPYLNYVGGNLEANHYLELVRNKLKRLKRRN